jgi:hypothetical protein
MKVLFPTGRFIGPGFQTIQTVREEEEEIWWMGNLIETKIHQIHETHGVDVPMPGEGFRGTFFFGDHEFTIVRDDDLEFWGGQTKAEFLEDLKRRNEEGIQRGAAMGWWDIGPDGNPQKPAQKISKSEMEAENKPLMAHLMVDLGFFPSVSQARKNGWDKPLELGRHELGPKKKRAFVEIIP